MDGEGVDAGDGIEPLHQQGLTSTMTVKATMGSAMSQFTSGARRVLGQG